jgi:membrane protease YdiL (CAAX protease family)
VLARPLLASFAAAYALTLLAAVVVYGPTLLGHDTPSAQLWRALAAFPLMVIGVGAAGVTLTTITAGRRGRRQLWARMRPGQAAARWYAVLLPPAAILTVLLLLRGAVSTAFTLGLNRYGLAFGLLAGFSEELGWTGYAWPRLRPRFWSTLSAGALLGLGWGLWHLPVIDHLGVHPTAGAGRRSRPRSSPRLPHCGCSSPGPTSTPAASWSPSCCTPARPGPWCCSAR